MNLIRRCKPLLGTYVEMQLAGDMSDDDLLDLSIAAFSEIEKVERLMSFHCSDSELSYVNRMAYQRPCAISAEMTQVLQRALYLSEISDGLFDVSIAPVLIHSGLLPDHGVATDSSAGWRDILLQGGMLSFNRQMQLDLGGIAKGFAVDQAIAVLPDGIRAMVNAGGDLRMTHWQDQEVAIRIPRQQSQAIELPMQAAAVATSACYYLDEKDAAASAIVLPASQCPINDERSFSVFAADAMLADALTKIVFLAPERAALLKQLDAFAVMVDEQGCVQQLQ
ncbi:MAG: FAD:protein FMN transferase [Pseudomonadales bacterium]